MSLIFKGLWKREETRQKSALSRSLIKGQEAHSKYESTLFGLKMKAIKSTQNKREIGMEITLFGYLLRARKHT